METIITIGKFVSEFILQILSWMVGLMFDEAANWLRRKFLFNQNNIIITKENIEFRFNQSNLVEINYEITNKTPYSFKIIGIKGNLEVFERRITEINRIEFITVERDKKTNIRIEFNLNNFEFELIQKLKANNELLVAEFTATHIITRTGDFLSFIKSIKDKKVVFTK